ncbi:hypothetical protein [Microbacterium sp. GXS0129]|uniref:hypothetical protein n=1 Tax=Microbacterium sp. GXS0129 TaxID=3377836 RepID=UPI00383AF0F5
MGANWSAHYPDSGDMSAVRAAAAWCDQQIVDVEGIDTVAAGVLDTRDDFWRGCAADEFSAALSRLRTRADDSRETLYAASKALKVYADLVDEIALEAPPFRAALASAQASFTGGRIAARRFADYQAEVRRAYQTIENANAGLAALATRRDKADRALARSLLLGASESWSSIAHTPASSPEVPAWLQRKRANEDTWQLLGSWIAGDKQAYVLGQQDAFTQRIQQSDYIREQRERILDDLRQGRLSAGYIDRNGDGLRDPSDAIWHGVSNDPLRLITDVGTVLGVVGTSDRADVPIRFENLPDTFLGSYLLNFFVEEPGVDGSVLITYIVENDTTIDSATRIPVLGGHGPVSTTG